MEKLGSELEFISQINRDGSGVTKHPKEHYKHLDNEVIKIYSLSLSKQTYIALGFNSYVVKLKTK